MTGTSGVPGGVCGRGRGGGGDGGGGGEEGGPWMEGQ